MPARRLDDPQPRDHQVLLQRSWWFWGVEYTLVANDVIRAEIPSVRGAVAEATYTPGTVKHAIRSAAILAHAKACEIVARTRPRLRPIEREVVVRARLPQTRRGCCNRCDGCGAGFAQDGTPGCRPGAPAGQPARCSEGDRAKRRSSCAGCARPYEPAPKPAKPPEGQYDFYGIADDDPALQESRPAPARGDRKWTEAPRPASLPARPELTRKERRLHLQLAPWYGQRPRKRSECANVRRPCPFVTCSMNLYLNVHPDTGAIQLSFPHLDPTEMKDSCALDVAERGGVTCEELGQMLNVSLEGASQMVDKALVELREKVEPEALAALVRGAR